jgi:hypothetical protein
VTSPHGWLGAEAEAARRLLADLSALGLDDESQELTVASETNFLEAVERALAEADECEMLCRGIEHQMQALGKREDRLEAKRDRIRDMIATAIEASGVKLPLRLPAATLSISTRAGKIVVTDEAAIPADYWRVETTRTLDRRALAEAVKAGPVPGVTAGNSTRSLTIRR